MPPALRLYLHLDLVGCSSGFFLFGDRDLDLCLLFLPLPLENLESRCGPADLPRCGPSDLPRVGGLVSELRDLDLLRGLLLSLAIFLALPPICNLCESTPETAI